MVSSRVAGGWTPRMRWTTADCQNGARDLLWLEHRVHDNLPDADVATAGLTVRNVALCSKEG